MLSLTNDPKTRIELVMSDNKGLADAVNEVLAQRDAAEAKVAQLQSEADHFYNVAFHELRHWTGHKSRLDCDLSNRFGSRVYAAKKLVAEVGAAFLCADFGFDGDVRNAGYIASWIEVLKAHKRAFFTACGKASKAVDYLRGLALAEAAAAA